MTQRQHASLPSTGASETWDRLLDAGEVAELLHVPVRWVASTRGTGCFRSSSSVATGAIGATPCSGGGTK